MTWQPPLLFRRPARVDPMARLGLRALPGKLRAAILSGGLTTQVLDVCADLGQAIVDADHAERAPAGEQAGAAAHNDAEALVLSTLYPTTPVEPQPRAATGARHGEPS